MMHPTVVEQLNNEHLEDIRRSVAHHRLVKVATQNQETKRLMSFNSLRKLIARIRLQSINTQHTPCLQALQEQI
jgi:hypothetical protein